MLGGRRKTHQDIATGLPAKKGHGLENKMSKEEFLRFQLELQEERKRKDLLRRSMLVLIIVVMGLAIYLLLFTSNG